MTTLLPLLPHLIEDAKRIAYAIENDQTRAFALGHTLAQVQIVVLDHAAAAQPAADSGDAFWVDACRKSPASPCLNGDDVEAAKKVTLLLNDPRSTFRKIAETQAATGDIWGAWEIATSLDATMLSSVLQAIAAAQAKLGDVGAAPATIECRARGDG